MNEFLKTRSQITEATKWLLDNGYMSHPISAKDFELASVIKAITETPLLDMGADGSFVLHNSVKKLGGRNVGIDLQEVTGSNKAEGAEYFVGDLMHTNFSDEEFKTIVCCSVLEHSVEYKSFAKEVSRLLQNDGNLFLSFDFWPDPINTEGLLLYGLQWNILSLENVYELLNELSKERLRVTSQTDFTVQDKVINDTYCSPFAGIGYTFSMLNFIKQ